MRITFFIGSLGGGGAERITCELANYLTGKGNHVCIVVNSEVTVGYDISDGVRVIPLIKKNEKYSAVCRYFKRATRLKRFLIEDDSDCYISMSTVGVIFLSLFKRYIRKPFIVAERANPDSYSKLIKSWIPRITRIADAFIFQTQGAHQWYVPYIVDKPYTIIPNAISNNIATYKRVEKRDKRIVGVGRLSQEKNFQMLIRAFSRIQPSFPDYTLTIYGEGKERKNLEILIDKLKMREYVFLPGFKKTIAEEISSAEIFVLSSNCEGMPNALIEAMSLGLCCISTNCPSGGPEYLIKDSKNGFLFPIGDEDQLVRLMKDLIENKEVRKSVGEEAIRITHLLAPETIYNEWMMFIEKVIKKV